MTDINNDTEREQRFSFCEGPPPDQILKLLFSGDDSDFAKFRIGSAGADTGGEDFTAELAIHVVGIQTNKGKLWKILGKIVGKKPEECWIELTYMEHEEGYAVHLEEHW